MRMAFHALSAEIKEKDDLNSMYPLSYIFIIQGDYK